MNIARYLLFSALLLGLSSCGNICRKDTKTDEIKPVPSDSVANTGNSNPTTIQMNKSIVLAEVLEIKPEQNSNYSLKIKVLEISEDPAYPSFASKDIIYELKPAYGVDEQGKLLKNDINEGLLTAGNLKKGDRFRGIISLERDMKWYLENLLNKE